MHSVPSFTIAAALYNVQPRKVLILEGTTHGSESPARIIC